MNKPTPQATQEASDVAPEQPEGRVAGTPVMQVVQMADGSFEVDTTLSPMASLDLLIFLVSQFWTKLKSAAAKTNGPRILKPGAGIVQRVLRR